MQQQYCADHPVGTGSLLIEGSVRPLNRYRHSLVLASQERTCIRPGVKLLIVLVETHELFSLSVDVMEMVEGDR